MNYYAATTGKSGGQKAKLAFTILASALSAQYGLSNSPSDSPDFRLVVIDEHSAILRELLEVVLGDRANQGAATFADRFHLLTEPPQIRFRFLDSSLQAALAWPIAECTIPLPAFPVPQERILRVEAVEAMCFTTLQASAQLSNACKPPPTPYCATRFDRNATALKHLVVRSVHRPGTPIAWIGATSIKQYWR